MKNLNINKQQAFNSEQGLFKFRTSPFPYNKAFSGSLISLKDWCSINFYSINQGYSLIKKKRLLATKIGGRWYVRNNPDCLI